MPKDDATLTLDELIDRLTALKRESPHYGILPVFHGTSIPVRSPRACEQPNGWQSTESGNFIISL